MPDSGPTGIAKAISDKQMAKTSEQPTSTSATTVADGAVGVPGSDGIARRWYVAIVNPRHEKKVAERLSEQGYESFVATQRERHLWANGRKKMVDRVVISSIVFIRVSEAERRRVVTLPYILRFMVNRAVDTGGLNRPPAVIPDVQIDRLRFMLGQTDTPVGFVPTAYRIKDNVRVIRGQFKGLEGAVMANSDGTTTLTVGLDLLGGATVKIDPHDVEKIEN